MDKKYKNKKVLIFGLGLNQGGVGSAKFFASHGARVRVTDLKTKEVLQTSIDELKQFLDIEYTLGEHKNEDIKWADLIIKNPAVKPTNPYIEYAKKIGKPVDMDMGIFLQNVKPSQIIGITGTKGKSTTSSLIYEILKETKNAIAQNVVFAGNIGSSVLEIIPDINEDTLVILEISSFQLESFEKYKVSPKWAVITNIYPDHLNYYSSMEEYVSSKKIIGKYQNESDFLFIRKNDEIVDNEKFLSEFNGKIIRFSKNELPENLHTNLLGEHNLENIAGVLKLVKTFGIDEKKALDIISNFQGVPFRMELVRQWKGFKIYNDTTATNPSATIQALKALGIKDEDKEPNVILICGGMNKNMDYKELSETIDWYAKAVYFLEGDVVDEIICNMNEKPIIEGRFDNLEKLLLTLKQNLLENNYFKKGDIILFSPAATSFNLFQNEFDRGRKFNKAVEKVFGISIF